MPTLMRPLESRLEQVQAMMHAAAQASPYDHRGNLFIHEGKSRLWLTHYDRAIGALFHEGQKPCVPQGFEPHEVAQEITRVCGTRMLRLLRVLHRHWPREGQLWLAVDQAVWAGPGGLRAVRGEGRPYPMESHWHSHLGAWRRASQDMAPGQVAISGSFHQRLELLPRLRHWAGPHWSLSPIDVPTYGWMPGPLFLFRFDDQVVLCKAGATHPEFHHAWRL